MDRIEQLQIFVRVAESGGFSSAAAQLGLPRPTVSLAIRQLETRLGVRLFNRTTRQVSLSSDGAALLTRAISLIADYEELEQQCRPGPQALHGRLRIDLPSRIARLQVAPALPAWLAAHPGLEVELGCSDRPQDLALEGIDCALRVGELASSSLVARPLGAFTMLSCASPEYLARHGVPQHPEQLDHHLAVGYALAGSGRPAPWEWLVDGQLRSRPVPVSVTVNHAETYLACALAGLGMIQVPAYDVASYLQQGSLQPVLREWPLPAMPVHLLYPHRRQLSQRLQVFSDWLADCLAPYTRPPPAAASR